MSLRPRPASPFADRTAAGDVLGAEVARLLAGEPAPVVLGLPRGGVPVAAGVARALGAPLDVLVVRKLGVPGHEELAFGALASGGVRVLNDDVVAEAGLGEDEMAEVARREGAELERREHRYRPGRPPVEVQGRTVDLVDDGLATGATMSAAVHAVRVRAARRVVVAVPVGSAFACDRLAAEADALLCCLEPVRFQAVGRWYRDFTAVGDDAVAAILASGG
ncbi:phosphoribosyltransferase [Baekduia soli]|uniref:Phosphoribosyltransferase n=1 Tax=Baekduia soli TaxID=496014 RepID=A0A5B8U8A8_9ACTN|nr:phosphoribosyltransferase family protein [Baekduia soli]QEC49048.1 phosphoribosyltransferase [Baekduia soli]